MKPRRKFRYRKTSTQWLWDGLEELPEHQLRPQLLERMAVSAVVQERFWLNVNISRPKVCWPWEGLLSPLNYGRYSFQPIPGKKVEFRTHRLAYFFCYGEIPKHLCVCHHCDNPPCCNPHHLFLGTSPENTYDRNEKERQARGEGHAMHILTEKQVKMIRFLRETKGTLIKDLAQMFKMAWYTIWEIVSYRSWKHVK